MHRLPYNNVNQSNGTSGGGPLQFSGTLSKPAQVTVGGQTATYGNYYSTNFSGMANVTTGTNNVSVVAKDVNNNTSTNQYQVVIPASTSSSPAYDRAGNETSNGNGQTYQWDAKNQLMTINYSGSAVINGITQTQFTYDGFGRRVEIVEMMGTSPSTTKQFVWAGNTIAEERASNGTTVNKRFFAQGEQISGVNYTTLAITSALFEKWSITPAPLKCVTITIRTAWCQKYRTASIQISSMLECISTNLVKGRTSKWLVGIVREAFIQSPLTPSEVRSEVTTITFQDFEALILIARDVRAR